MALLSSMRRLNPRPASSSYSKQRRWLLPLALLALVLLAVVLVALLSIRAVQEHVIQRPLRFLPCHVCGSSDSSTSTQQQDEGAGVASGEGAVPLDAISYICTGTGCDVDLLCTSSRALRVAGGWKGPLYAITDRPDDIKCESDVQPVSVPKVNHQMHMKNMKRKLLDILPGPPAAALYIDVDIVPVGCIQQFLRNLLASSSQLTSAGGAQLAFFRDNVCFGCNTFNGGFVYQRDTPGTRKCLEEWNTESSANNFTKYIKDQDALDQVLSREGNACAVIHTLPSSETVFIDSALWPAWMRMQASRPFFQHFTSGVRAGTSWDRIHSAMAIQLNELEDERARLESSCKTG